MDDLTRHMHQLVKERTGQTHLKAVIGCSIGGVLALRYAMMFPKDVDMVMAVAAPGIKAPEDKAVLWSQRIKLFEQDQENGTDQLCHATVNRWFPGGPEDDAVRAESLQHVKTCSLQGYKFLADTIRNFDYADELAEKGIPGVRCFVAGGTQDGAISLDALQDVASKTKDAKYMTLEGAGHLPPMHKPKEFNDLMLWFIGSP